MATTKPRTMVTLEPETYATFKRFAELSRRPMATIISELLTGARPEFEKLGVLLQQARDLESRSQHEQAKFLARIEVMANRASASQEFIQSDLVTSLSRPVAPPVRGAKGRPAATKKPREMPPVSLIHTNKPSNPLPTRVPARSSSKKANK